jgi:hypothetical protein
VVEVVEFNIFASVETTEVDLAPYPGGSATVPAGRVRKIYFIVLSNVATGANTLTLRIYRGTTLEASVDINLASPGMVSITGRKTEPLLIIPSGRTLRAIASEASVHVVMAGYDE